MNTATAPRAAVNAPTATRAELPHAELRATAAAVLASIRPLVIAGIAEARDGGIAQRLLNLALSEIDTAEGNASDPRMTPEWVEINFGNLNALMVAATWSPGAVKGPWSTIIRATELMSRSQLVPHPIRDHVKVPPGALKPEEFTDWRVKTAALLAQVEPIIQEALDLDPQGICAETNMLLYRAESVRAAMEMTLLDPDESRDTFLYESYELMALLKGAKGFADTPKAIRLLLDTAIDQIDDASNEGPGLFLDGEGGDDPGHTRPEDAFVSVPELRMREEAAPAITKDTALPDGGEASNRLMQLCTYEISALAGSIIDEADSGMERGDFTENTDAPYLLRAAGSRIFELNSLLMSFLTEDSVTLQDAARTLHRTSELNDCLGRTGGAQ